MTATETEYPASGHVAADRRGGSLPFVTLSIADLVTLGNAVCGFFAIWRLAAAKIAEAGDSASGVPPHRRDIAAVVVLLLAAATCDLFDGIVARRFGGSRLGAELDNLADAVSFGVAPAFFVVTWGVGSPAADATVVSAVAAAVLVAVIVRLARFACQPASPGSFTGLPSPLGAMTVVAIVLLGPPPPLALVGIAVVALLMVSRIRYPKPRGNLAFGVLAWIVASVGCLAAWALHLPGGNWLLASGGVLVISLTAMVPVYMLVTRGEGTPVRDAEADQGPEYPRIGG